MFMVKENMSVETKVFPRSPETLRMVHVKGESCRRGCRNSSLGVG
jgi:hypothetical protein